jgi:hypothetical protein
MITAAPPSAIHAAPFQMTHFLGALSQVESNNNDEAVGRHHELGRFQIKKILWERFTPLPFSLARFRFNSTKIAEKIISAYVERAEEKGVPANLIPDVIAQWWVMGESHEGPIPAFQRDHIQRIVNLYMDISAASAPGSK